MPDHLPRSPTLVMPLEIIAIQPNPNAKKQSPQEKPVATKNWGDRPHGATWADSQQALIVSTKTQK